MEWLGLSKQERINAVRDFHEHSGDGDFINDKALTTHSCIHVVIEDQLALKLEYLPETLSKLIRQGLEHHEAVHAIGAILTDETIRNLRGETSEVSTKQYKKKLEKLTAKRWKKGQY